MPPGATRYPPRIASNDTGRALMIALNDLARHHAPLRAALDAAIARVQDRGHYILGPEVEAFEREFAAYCGAASCVAVANGTDALELALRSLDVGAGDEVATVANAGGYASAAIRAVGALPLYVDIDEATLLMDPASLALRITARTRAVVATHLYGRLADVGAIANVATERRIALVEDCAQAHGARRAGKKAGTFGAIGCFSFYPTKNLGALGDAGALLVEDPAVAATLRRLRNGGQSDRYRHEVAGLNSRLDEIQAAILRVGLRHLDGWTKRRRALSVLYSQGLEGLGLTLPVEEPYAMAVQHLFVIRHPRRDALAAGLEARGVGTLIHYPIPLHLQPAFAGCGGKARDFPVAEAAAREILSLPLYPALTDAQVLSVVAATRATLREMA